MSAQKKRGLGRGLGALIPSGPEGDRPVDVFFPAAEREGERLAPVSVEPDEGAGDASDALTKSGVVSGRSMSWDAAMSSGRLAIRTAGGPRLAAAGASADSTAVAEEQDASEAGVMAQRTGDQAGHTTVVTESSGVGPAEIGVVTGATPVVGGELASVTPIGSVRVPHDALASRGGAVAASRVQAFSDGNLGAVSRETSGGVDADSDLLPVPGASFAELPVAAIRPNTWQPRTVFDETELDELVESIKEIGVLQPIVVRPDRDGDGQYELIMGERRWRATQLAGLDTVPAIIRETDDADMLRNALLENLHRAQLNPLEEAAAYRQLLDDFGCTHEELATRIARSRPQISNTLRLLKLPPLVQRRVAAGILSAGHARALLGLTDGAEIERLAQRIVSEGLSVRATEEIVTLMGSERPDAKTRAPRAGQRSVAVDDLAGRLSDRFETRVKVQVGKSKGRLTVEFASVEDLNRILAVMAPDDPGLLKS
ncbi:ParB/RepB/Spo0J family partition protein [Xylanimonas ulmi]|uniref:ParB family chromosome partitioning protein n=1 Tax=Xylanimonas ulmi TaxID=228973 RepID=A0A4Q7M5C9_9MICO|nr:ParB/RepB/Spo0J family partition protein [Xylanibacterium ulmi]RZS62631.1 ParB family chromosome partitioning protein [Xylanibacterium ulmi]